jgi:hypothetical protein
MLLSSRERCFSCRLPKTQSCVVDHAVEIPGVVDLIARLRVGCVESDNAILRVGLRKGRK